eukprot:CAMPEP_0198210814 /NCGR_PEP_ID=MMETSP1445-20131203/22460_1 /TAXON_ID=36898 /ORGANISM="Pyramimonas sp., Strain CCMP2087" /LENGTH=286 /DNA_ID=CAMNT_0043884969 /DNA_START=117 /DNA_END=977 /DNA_ORIENTATION=+
MSREQVDAFMTGADIQQLKDYVGAEGKGGGANQGESTVLLHCSHTNLKAQFMELRFDRHTTIERVKERLQSHCGTSPSMMQLQLKDYSGQVVYDMADNTKMLGYYSPEDGWGIHIIDLDPMSLSRGGWLEDVGLVEKYEISDEDYYKRENNFRKYKEEKLRADPTWSIKKQMAIQRGQEYVPPEPVMDPDHMAEFAAGMEVGLRCEVNPGGKRGEVKFVGKAEKGLPLGYWVGVQFDEPVGKNNGTAKGVKYFECAENYGSMLRPNMVDVGDYPEIDEFDLSEDEI